MIKLYYNLGPNPMKVALLLEEIGLLYEALPIDTFRGDQLTPAFLQLNPNGKVPVIEHGGLVVFDSNAILLHLSELHGKFGGTSETRHELLSWLMFVASGLGPYAGQAAHFRGLAPDPKDYAVERYTFEARRHFQVIDTHLAANDWMVGGAYSIVDMAVWGWSRMLPFVLGPDAPNEFSNLARLMAAINARPATDRVMALRDRHPFKQERDDEFWHSLFPYTKGRSMLQPAARA